MSKLFLIHILITVLALSNGETLSYGIDIDDGNGLRLYTRVQPKCLVYKAVDIRKPPLYLFFTSGQWKIFQKLSYTITDQYCTVNYAEGDILYHQQEEEKPHSEGWYDHKNNQSDVILSVYALEECTTYKGAYVDSQNFYSNIILPNRHMDSCMENAFSFNYVQPIIVTTNSQSMGSSNLVCRFCQVGYISSAIIIPSDDDEEAHIFLGDKNCYNDQILGDSPTIILHISEAKSHNENFNRIVSTEDPNTGGLPHGLSAVIGAVGGGAVVLLLLLCVWWKAGWGCCCKEKSVAGPGHYGRASIDSNFQYGEGQEYYHYQKDKNQTRVVDENEMYTNYEHE